MPEDPYQQRNYKESTPEQEVPPNPENGSENPVIFEGFKPIYNKIADLRNQIDGEDGIETAPRDLISNLRDLLINQNLSDLAGKLPQEDDTLITDTPENRRELKKALTNVLEGLEQESAKRLAEQNLPEEPQTEESATPKEAPETNATTPDEQTTTPNTLPGSENAPKQESFWEGIKSKWGEFKQEFIEAIQTENTSESAWKTVKARAARIWEKISNPEKNKTLLGKMIAVSITAAGNQARRGSEKLADWIDAGIKKLPLKSSEQATPETEAQPEEETLSEEADNSQDSPEEEDTKSEEDPIEDEETPQGEQSLSQYELKLESFSLKDLRSDYARSAGEYIRAERTHKKKQAKLNKKGNGGFLVNREKDTERAEEAMKRSKNLREETHQNYMDKLKQMATQRAEELAKSGKSTQEIQKILLDEFVVAEERSLNRAIAYHSKKYLLSKLWNQYNEWLGQQRKEVQALVRVAITAAIATVGVVSGGVGAVAFGAKIAVSGGAGLADLGLQKLGINKDERYTKRKHAEELLRERSKQINPQKLITNLDSISADYLGNIQDIKDKDPSKERGKQRRRLRITAGVVGLVVGNWDHVTDAAAALGEAGKEMLGNGITMPSMDGSVSETLNDAVDSLRTWGEGVYDEGAEKFQQARDALLGTETTPDSTTAPTPTSALSPEDGTTPTETSPDQGTGKRWSNNDGTGIQANRDEIWGRYAGQDDAENPTTPADDPATARQTMGRNNKDAISGIQNDPNETPTSNEKGGLAKNGGVKVERPTPETPKPTGVTDPFADLFGSTDADSAATTENLTWTPGRDLTAEEYQAEYEAWMRAHPSQQITPNIDTRPFYPNIKPEAGAGFESSIPDSPGGKPGDAGDFGKLEDQSNSSIKNEAIKPNPTKSSVEGTSLRGSSSEIPDIEPLTPLPVNENILNNLDTQTKTGVPAEVIPAGEAAAETLASTPDIPTEALVQKGDGISQIALRQLQDQNLYAQVKDVFAEQEITDDPRSPSGLRKLMEMTGYMDEDGNQVRILASTRNGESTIGKLAYVLEVTNGELSITEHFNDGTELHPTGTQFETNLEGYEYSSSGSGNGGAMGRSSAPSIPDNAPSIEKLAPLPEDPITAAPDTTPPNLDNLIADKANLGASDSAISAIQQEVVDKINGLSTGKDQANALLYREIERLSGEPTIFTTGGDPINWSKVDLVEYHQQIQALQPGDSPTITLSIDGNPETFIVNLDQVGAGEIDKEIDGILRGRNTRMIDGEKINPEYRIRTSDYNASFDQFMREPIPSGLLQNLSSDYGNRGGIVRLQADINEWYTNNGYHGRAITETEAKMFYNVATSYQEQISEFKIDQITGGTMGELLNQLEKGRVAQVIQGRVDEIIARSQ